MAEEQKTNAEGGVAVAKDLYTQEERDGPTNRPAAGRKSLSELEGDKRRSAMDAAQERRAERQKRIDELDRASGRVVLPDVTRIRVRPAKQFSINGVNTEAGGKIIGEIEVERSLWIIRRIRDGSLEVVSEVTDQATQGPTEAQPPPPPPPPAPPAPEPEPVPEPAE